MHSVKNIGFILASSALLTSCAVSRPGLYNPRVKQFAHDMQQNHETRGLSIALKEAKEPEGFLPANQEFAVSRKSFGDIFQDDKGKITRGRMNSRIGINIKDSTYFLQGRDFSQPPNARCNYAATIYLGKYDDQSEELKTMFPEAVAAITTSKHKLYPASDDIFYQAFDSSRIMLIRRLGAGFTQKGMVDLNQKTLAHGSCDFQGPASQKAYQDNKTMVELARKCVYNKDFRADGYTHYIKNLKTARLVD